MKIMSRTSAKAMLLLVGCSMPALAYAGDMTGHVADASGTKALQAATVSIPSLGRSVVTDRDGGYVITDLPAGDYDVEVRYVGAETTHQKVSVAAQGRTTADFSVGSVGNDELLVVGLAANQASALSRQKAADGVSSVLTRDAVGQFPDQNVAESLRRLPGVNIMNDQGEGRFVSVRGLDPELNSTSLNGVRLPAPESDTRAVALDVISSDTIESIEVKKSMTPDMDGDTIGASIEIKTTSAFDRKKNYYSANLEGSYNDYRGKLTPKGGLDFSTRLTDNFGVTGGFSYYKRDFETDNIETSGWKTGDNGVDYADEVEYRDYDVQRKRINGSLNFDYRASDTTTLYARGNFSQFDDHEYRRRTTFIFDGDPASGSDDSASFSSEDDRIEVRRDIKDRFERQRIRTIAVGGDTDTGEWKFNWQGSWAKSTEKEDFSLDPTRFRARFDDGDNVGVTMNYADNREPLYTITSGADAVNDPTNYKFNRIELTDMSNSQDREYAAKADLARVFAMDGGTFTVQGGVKSRWRKKSYDFDMVYYGDYDGDYTLADVLGEQTYRLTDMGPVASKTGPTDFFLENRDNFEVDEYETALNSATSDYSVKEDILASYLLGRWDSDTLRVIGGVRMERTWNQLNGNLVSDDGDDVVVNPVSFERHYTDWLPSLTLRFSPQENMIFRAAVSKSLMRPKLSRMAPRFYVNDDNEAEFGNPELKPYRSWNFDAGWDYYFSGNGAISVGGFYKTIDNFIVDVNYQDYTYEGETYTRFQTSVNGGKAEVMGIEASFSQALDFLPSPLDGFLVQANYTYTYSKGSVMNDDMIERTIALPSNSRNTFNVVLGYEKGPFSFRAAGTYRDKYLDEVGGAADEDRYVDNHFQLDLSAKYKLTKNVRLFAEWVNVNNAKYFAYQNYNNRQRLLQFEKYGPTIKGGVKVNF